MTFDDSVIDENTFIQFVLSREKDVGASSVARKKMLAQVLSQEKDVYLGERNIDFGRILGSLEPVCTGRKIMSDRVYF